MDRCECDTPYSARVALTDILIELPFPMSHAELCPQDGPMVCVGTYTLTQADVDSGTRSNTVEVTSTSPDGTTTRDSHDNTVNIVGSATVTIGESCIEYTFVPVPLGYRLLVCRRGAELAQ